MQNNEQTNFLVSVHCMTYNHSKYILDALGGFTMQQTEFPYVCIVIDDASTDGEPEILRKYFSDNFEPLSSDETDDYVRTYGRHKVNRNCYFVVIYLKYNHYSIKKPKQPYYAEYESSAKYIALCEGDDYWIDAEKLQKQSDALENHPECTICFNRVQAIKAIEKTNVFLIPRNNVHFFTGNVTLGDLVEEEFKKYHWCFHTSSFFYRSELRNLITEFKQKIVPSFPYGDMPLQMCALSNGDGYFIDNIMGCYRLFSGGYNSTLKRDKNLKVVMTKKVCDGFLEFDKYTCYKYHRIIKIRNRRDFYFQIYEGYSLNPNYWRFIPIFICNKIANLLQIKLPKVYSLLKQLKQKILD